MHLFLSTPILHPLDTLPRAKSLQHICPQLLKGPWVSFSPLELVWHWCVGRLVSEHIQTALSRWKSSRKCSVSQARLLALCNALLSKRHRKSCSWESISFVSAFTGVWTGQAGANVSIGPWYVWYYALKLNISDFICQLILAHSLPLPQCHRRCGVMLFHT